MMREELLVAVVDGQGGGMGRGLVEAVKKKWPRLHVRALGTNSLATAAMLRAGADDGERPVYVSDAAGSIDVVFGEENFTPYRIIADYNFLLGRTLADDLVSYSGETLARRGERVSVETVEKARRHGKLMDLTLSSR